MPYSREHMLGDPPYPQFALGPEVEDDGDEPFPEVEYDACVGPDDPGVGPWTDEFAD